MAFFRPRLYKINMSREVCLRCQSMAGLIVAVATLGGPAAWAAAPAGARPVVAVFAIENKGAQLEPSSGERIADYVGAQLVAYGGFLVVPPETLRQALAKQKAESYRDCYDESCRIEIGQELAAEKALAGAVARIGTRCVVTLKLYDLRQSAQEAAGTAKGSCDEDGVLDSIETALRRLVGRPQVVRTPPKPASRTAERASDRALLKRAEQAQRGAQNAHAEPERPYEVLVDAWGAVSKIARASAITRGLRLATIERFLLDFPNNNPYHWAATTFSTALAGGLEPLEATDMVPVPAGEFVMGCNRGRDVGCDRDAVRARPVSLGMFYIDRTEVTVAAYRRCVAAGRCSAHGLTVPLVDGARRPHSSSECNWSHSDREDHPINCVDWYQARTFCGWVNKRLPSEQEWEKAARGSDGRPFPWGRPERRNAVVEWRRSTTAPVGSITAGASPFGAMDMVGNVWEWTITRKNGARWRGGSFVSRLEAGLVYLSRNPGYKSFRARHVGFRCASTVPPYNQEASDSLAQRGTRPSPR